MPGDRQQQNAICRLLAPLTARGYTWLKKLKPDSFPRTVIVETTSRCNLRCPICPRDRMKRQAGDMPPEIFDSLVEELARHDEREELELVALHFFGDPLMHPQIMDMIEQIGSRLPNLRKLGELRDPMRGLGTSTNALLLDEDKIEALLDSKLTWLGIAMDATSEMLYRSMHGSEKWDMLVHNVECLLEANAARPRHLPTIGLQIIQTADTAAEIETFQARWEHYTNSAQNVQIVVKPFTNWAGQIDTPARAPWYFTTPCTWPWRALVVCSDGQVAPCCYDMDCTMRLGKVPEQTLEEIWNSEPVRGLREQLRSGRLAGLELCHHCEEARTHLRRFLP